MNKVTTWVLINSLFVLCIYEAVHNSNTGIANVLVFYLAFIAFTSLFYMSDEVQDKMKESGPSIPIQLDIFFDVCIIAHFVYCSWWVCGVLYCIPTERYGTCNEDY